MYLELKPALTGCSPLAWAAPFLIPTVPVSAARSQVRGSKDGDSRSTSQTATRMQGHYASVDQNIRATRYQITDGSGGREPHDQQVTDGIVPVADPAKLNHP